MAWTAYQVTFRLLSPMHIGWRKVGNMQQTRPYVTGRNLWGVLTARLVRSRMGSDYERIGKEVVEQLTFSYLYPSWEIGRVACWPWGDTWDEFAWTFLGSNVSTALASGRSAEEGSLHETEYIAPYTRALPERNVAAGAPVYLVGYIFVADGCRLRWQDVLNQLQLGGERGYGWGRLSLERCQEVQDGSFFGLYRLDCAGPRPRLTATGSTSSPQAGSAGANGGQEVPLLAHLDTQGQSVSTNANSQTQITGRIEPLLGRKTDTHTGQFGVRLSLAKICGTPGSTVPTGREFTIGAHGIWELV